ncbi:MAG: DUF1232 domain-containing protein [Candidatus Nanopelagicales bacterium]|jgi:uncharacterized membrane protein YkvA (DUF1232 family)|nr:DUF1232 domain-containing protein [Candidatus Nanopelagicales bacterium]
MSRRRRKAAIATAAAAAMKEGPTEVGSRVASIPGLVRDTLSGTYPGLTKQRLAMMVAALLYLVSPIDLVPEALLLIPGLLDDIAVAGWLVAATMGATTAYRDWRMGLDGVPQAEPRDARRHEVIQGEVIAH